jgi:hypothetical protein
MQKGMKKGEDSKLKENCLGKAYWRQEWELTVHNGSLENRFDHIHSNLKVTELSLVRDDWKHTEDF